MCLLFLTYAIIAVVDYTHVGSDTASFKDLETDAQENSTNQTANSPLSA